MLCERGTMFGYSDLVVDARNLLWMRDANCPIVADITHALQQPAGRSLGVRLPKLPPFPLPLPPPPSPSLTLLQPVSL